jgi:hypothetical protein
VAAEAKETEAEAEPEALSEVAAAAAAATVEDVEAAPEVPHAQYMKDDITPSIMWYVCYVASTQKSPQISRNLGLPAACHHRGNARPN